MKRLLILILFVMSFFLHVSTCYSQTISSDIISNSGEEFIAGKINLNWTLGEAVVDIHENEDIIHTQGFHQTFIQNSTFSSESASNESLLKKQLTPSVSVYPNPTKDIVNILFTNVENNVLVELYNMAGQRLFNKEIPTKVVYQLDMKPYSDGSYLLHLTNDEKTAIQIIKTSK
ncbi:T9SS type A sorting domain-containing protein [uncultured Draconibacterium sp.]|uniref:T9SS type A sorting domain-containing protein n=1 Tax=uncultured Draconibacterium sp. TaxID=1573823 RepID=UPI0029C870FF|nr:T9SS type A sorting domain-containing protein [uncultured Draconibacterium sp.]